MNMKLINKHFDNMHPDMLDVGSVVMEMKLVNIT